MEPAKKANKTKTRNYKQKLRNKRNKNYIKTQKNIKNISYGGIKHFDYTKTLIIHGANSEETFILPENVEVITFSNLGYPLDARTGISLLNFLSKNFENYKNRSLNYLHNKNYRINHDQVRIRVYNGLSQIINFNLSFVEDDLSQVQKLFDTKKGKIYYSHPPLLFTSVKGIETAFTSNFKNSIAPDAAGVRHFTLEHFIKQLTANFPGQIRLFLLCCAGGEGVVEMLENVDVNLNTENAFY
jgi:hypothetical protein